jgi:polyhydroxyalkanoate synthesis repressor PhaR
MQRTFDRAPLRRSGGRANKRTMAVTTIKKYTNRRLYDTEESRYITLDELTDRVKSGTDVRVVDAKTGEDLTQATLVQIVLETKAARLLPVPLLAKLIRMQDDALADFFSRYVSFALEMYWAAKNGAQAISPYVPFANVPFSATNALARAMGALPFWGEPPRSADAFREPPYGGFVQAPPPPGALPPADAPERGDIATLRSELEELRRELHAQRTERVDPKRTKRGG